MKLYKLKASNCYTFYFTPEGKYRKKSRYNAITIAQTPSNDAFLLLAKDTFGDTIDELELLDSVPTGFDFTYCQDWGLTVDADVIDRVIIDLRKKSYPTWQDQLDDIYHNGIAGWKATIKTTKDKYPKS